MATTAITIDAGEGQRYQQKEEVWVRQTFPDNNECLTLNLKFGDGREEQLLDFVRSRCGSRSPAQPSDVLRLIDDFGVAHKYMMNIGAEKGQIVTDLIGKHKPRTMLELGGYIGYSTILFADALRRNGGKQYISFERDQRFASVAQALVELSGLEQVVRIVVGSSSKSLTTEQAAGRLNQADMIFLDHYKPAYVRDIKICESLGVIHQGTVLAADNVISPGNPPYLEYVRSSPDEKQQKLSAKSSSQALAFPERATNQYHKSQYEEDDTELPGVPEIVYESQLFHSHEPTGEPDGVEVTICKFVPAEK